MKTLDTRIRIQLKNILFLTDFFPVADAAIPYATDLTVFIRTYRQIEFLAKRLTKALICC
jgi:hypothetical protein